MRFLIEQIVSGLTLGGVYALIAIGYSLMFGVLKLLNFAHGDVYMVGAFIGYFVLTGLGGPSHLTVPVAVAILLMLAAGGLGSGLLGLCIERVAFRPLRDAPRTSPLIASLGISFLLEYSVLLVFSANARSYNTSAFIPFSTSITIDGVRIWAVRIVVVIFAAFVMYTVRTLLVRTRLGKQMRAVAYDREAAAMMGINVDRTISTAFFVGSVLAGIAGVSFALVFSEITFNMGFLAGLKGFSAAVVGGIGNVPGAMFGGFAIGLAEAFSTGYISSTYQNVITFGILVAVVLLRPGGLFGRVKLQKV
jgi:branched-chain amino acid transport system permease protein